MQGHLVQPSRCLSLWCCPPTQVGFHEQSRVRKASVAKRVNDVINRLNRTREERFPDLEAEREAWEREQRGKDHARAEVVQGGGLGGGVVRMGAGG